MNCCLPFLCAQQCACNRIVKKKKGDERRSHGALCACTAIDMKGRVPQVLFGGGKLSTRTRMNCVVKSTFSETKMVPVLNDMLIANPSPAAVSRFRMGWLNKADNVDNKLFLNEMSASRGLTPADKLASSLSEPGVARTKYGTITRFGGQPYEVQNSLNVWSSGMWVCTSTGSTAAMAAAGGQPMDLHSNRLQYLIREHMVRLCTRIDCGSESMVFNLHRPFMGLRLRMPRTKMR